MSANSPPPVLQDRYRLMEHLASGGMGMVYLARDEMLDREVAIKFLDVRGKGGSERFMREARVVARLSHPNIMTLFDMGIEEGWHYQVLEYIPGKNLHQMMGESDGPLAIGAALRIIRDALSALGYAHAQGLVHRDIKPENIMLTPDDRVKVADFGLAIGKEDVRLTETDSVVGTALYMAPEVATTGQFDHRADLYALGAVFYELVAGRPPYTGETPVQILTQALNTPLTPPSMVNPAVPEVIESVIVRLLEKDPDRRYSSADDALAALPDASEIEKLLAEEVKRRTSDRLSRTLLERIVRSSTTHRKLSPGEVDTEDALISVTPDGEPEPLSQDLLVYAALEDTIEAVEAERRQMARRLQETVIDQLNLLLSQSNAYLQTVNNPAANMAISVLMTLTRQVLQQARDLESHLHPTVLESLGLEPALETLANQEMRARGLHIVLSLQRMRERLPPQLELTLFRTAQDAIDRAVRQAQCSHIAIRLYRRENDIFFSVDDNGLPPSGEILRHTRQRVEGLGGAVDFQRSQYGGLALTVQFAMESPADLTERELEVIRLVAEGLSNKEIGALLYISPRTVKFHLDNIYSKLGVNTRTEAAIFALRRGWVRQRPDPMDRSEPPKGSFMS